MSKKPKFYTGIGSRRAPKNILHLCAKYARELRRAGYTLRTGNAAGCDEAFAKGASVDKVVYSPNDAIPKNEKNQWAWRLILECMPVDRSGFANWKPHVQGLLVRNMMQVMGTYGTEPAEFVVCWAPSLLYHDSSAGGTGYALRCAERHNISICNLYSDEQKREFELHLMELQAGNGN